MVLRNEPRKHLIWFVNDYLHADLSKVTEIFIDATYNTSKLNTHLYGIVGQELGYGVPLGFMLMEIHPKEDTTTKKHSCEALECNNNFYSDAKTLGLDPHFVHTDKDFAEITACQVGFHSEEMASWMVGLKRESLNIEVS